MKILFLFSQDVTAPVLVSQDNETGAALLSQTNPVGVFFPIENLLF